MVKVNIAMSHGEIDRLLVIKKIAEKQLSQKEGAALLGLSKRHMIRIVQRYQKEGTEGLISKHRGRPSNRQCKEQLKEEVKRLIFQHYSDFGPTLTSEKLYEQHQAKVSKETCRHWMIEWGLWQAKRQKKVKIHQSRARRPCLGELVQIDGSPHDWFEGRGPYCCLVVFVDDATSQILALHFEASETTASYFKATREYIERCGRPLSFYSDKNSIFRVNASEVDEVTQFGRAMQELGIELIFANSPQAKGRVERKNGVLQDRLVKEMRLRGINDIESANAFLPEYREKHNRQFGKIAFNPTDMHRHALPDKATLDTIFSYQYERKLSKNLELSYEHMIYQVEASPASYGLRHAKVKVCENMEGKITLLYKGKPIRYMCQSKAQRIPRIMGTKQLNEMVEQVKKRAYKPSAKHPWRGKYKESDKLKKGVAVSPQEPQVA
jgi:transposase